MSSKCSSLNQEPGPLLIKARTNMVTWVVKLSKEFPLLQVDETEPTAWAKLSEGVPKNFGMQGKPWRQNQASRYDKDNSETNQASRENHGEF